MKTAWKFALACFLALTIAGCAAWKFQSRYSMNDPRFFSEPPRIVRKQGAYNLEWRFGSGQFYFLPDSTVRDGRLLFGLAITTSAGTATGKAASRRIEGRKQIRALESGGAFWVEPDGRHIQLPIANE